MTDAAFPPDDPREWLRRARSSLAMAQVEAPAVLHEDRVFSAQQAAEKALKALLLHRGRTIPRTHDLGILLERLEISGGTAPELARDADELTPYAITGRYPVEAQEPITDTDLRRAISIAAAVVAWAESEIGS